MPKVPEQLWLHLRLKETIKSTRTARHSELKSLDIDKRVVRLEMMVETGRQRRLRCES